MTKQQTIITDITDNIGSITLNRPEKHNAFNEVMIEELTESFTEMGNNDNIRVIIVRGNGKSFCAGGDLNWMRKTADYSFDENFQDAMKLGKLLKTINICPKPTIAEIYGNVFGGGIGICASCDIAIADKNAVFCLSEVRIGLIPSIIAPYVIAAIGERQAKRYFLTAERFNGEIAKNIGLVHEALDVSKIKNCLENIVNAILQGAPLAQKMGKELIKNVSKCDIDDKIVEYTSKKIAEARASKTGKEGLNAFLTKTEPSWRK